MHRYPDFMYIDAGEPLDDLLEALPYLGPNWYWRLNAKHILESGHSKAGRVTIDHVKHTFGASEHANCDALVEPLRAIGEIITAMFEKHKFRPRNVDPYTCLLYTSDAADE